jgi:hypothetical protein
VFRTPVAFCLTSTAALLAPRLVAGQQLELSVLGGYVRPSSVQSELHRPVAGSAQVENVITRQEGGLVAEARVGAWWTSTGIELGVNRAWSDRTTIRSIADVNGKVVQPIQSTREGATLTSFSLRVATRFAMTDEMTVEPAVGMIATSLGGAAYDAEKHDAAIEPSNDLSIGGIAAVGVHYDLSDRTHFRVILEDAFTKPSFGGKTQPPRPSAGVQSDLGVLIGFGFTR